MNEQNELVSILMPVYNVEKYIKKAIVSILDQTYKNFELIVVDDCSTDSTYGIAQKLALGDSRVKLFKNEENKKIARTLNAALQKAKGKYIARMDGDDISDPHRIEKLFIFLKTNTDINLVGSDILSIDEEDNIIGNTRYLSNQVLIEKTKKYASPVSHFWMTYKYVYDKLEGYRDISGVEDYDFLLRMNTAGYTFSNINEYLYYIRLRTEGNTRFTIGPVHIKLHDYAYRLYRERSTFEVDSFSEYGYKRCFKINGVLLLLHNFSSKKLLESIILKSKKKYCMMFFCICLSLISPYQIKYLYNRLKYRIIIKINNC